MLVQTGRRMVVLIQRLEGGGGAISYDKHVGGCFSIWKTIDDVA